MKLAEVRRASLAGLINAKSGPRVSGHRSHRGDRRNSRLQKKPSDILCRKSAIPTSPIGVGDRNAGVVNCESPASSGAFCVFEPKLVRGSRSGSDVFNDSRALAVGALADHISLDCLVHRSTRPFGERRFSSLSLQGDSNSDHNHGKGHSQASWRNTVDASADHGWCFVHRRKSPLLLFARWYLIGESQYASIARRGSIKYRGPWFEFRSGRVIPRRRGRA